MGGAENRRGCGQQIIMSSLACRFGDEEEWEDVPCSFDQQAGTVLCRRPLGSSNGHFIGTRMVAKGGSGVELPMVLNSREGESLSTPPSNERCSTLPTTNNWSLQCMKFLLQCNYCRLIIIIIMI